ncbi:MULTISPECIES: adenylate cyclase regulatory domain-containing protein [unclassified Mycobacterium]|uniref:adenylate cyclase regulatory domain-containing protein n=1 Tax=unclassified Mycobacterium TaxID=2642494 RepID=UPI0007FD9F67|nr:cyclase [Mycobacterium sp. E1214]OBH28358.1 cyclase [Mycobacterium sp. E1319]
MYVDDVDGGDRDIEDLLEGLDDAARTERAELARWLLEQGVSADEIKSTNPPLLLATRHLIGDDGTYVSAREISETHGVDLALLQKVQRAIGLARVDDPDAAVHMRADGEAAAFIQRFVELGLDPDQLLLVVRVLAEGLSRTAEVMRYTALAAIMRPGASELEIAKASKALVGEIAPLLGPMIEQMLFMQLRHTMETEAVNAAERAAGKPLPGARQVTVGFADLVGFTRIGEAVSPEELGHLANRLAALARDITVPPVRFIKTIGDAVMLVCPEPLPLLDVLVKLVDTVDGDNDFPRLRAGAAAGMAVSRAGDWFGSPVNVASRVTGVARPGTVLVADSVWDIVCDSGQFEGSFAGARRLKGIKTETKLFRIRRGA